MRVGKLLREMCLSSCLHLSDLCLHLRTGCGYGHHGRRVVMCDATVRRYLVGMQGVECTAQQSVSNSIIKGTN